MVRKQGKLDFDRNGGGGSEPREGKSMFLLCFLDSDILMQYR